MDDQRATRLAGSTVSGAGGVVLGVAGGLILLAAGFDLFVTVFNYDGFTFLAGRMHAAGWASLRAASRLLPGRARAGFLALGSAAMLPATLVLWLVLETAGFAMMYLPGLAVGDFSTSHHGLLGPQGAFYLSGGDLTSLTFGDVVARAAPYRALVDLETVVGLATFTIGLTYVLAAFDAVSTLNQLHGRVRRQTIKPNRPVTILARHFRDGQADQLSGLAQALVEDLAAYDDALRRYPVVFYFHTRRAERSIPRIYDALGEFIELVRWGLPASNPTTTDPYVLAMEDQYNITGRRLLRSFVGPPPPLRDEPLGQDRFREDFSTRACGEIGDFAELRAQAREAAGIETHDDPCDERLYQQYRDWRAFHERRSVVVSRVRRALCYESDSEVER